MDYRLSDGIGIVWVKVEGGIAADLPACRDIRGENRASATHRFEQRQAEPLIQRWGDKADGLVVKPYQLFVAHSAQIVDVVV